MSGRRWLGPVSSRRAAAEALLLVFVLILPYATIFAGQPESSRWPILTQASMLAGLLAGLYGAIRLGPPGPSRARRLAREVGGGLLVCGGIWLGAALSALIGFGLATGAAMVRGDRLAGFPAASPPARDPWQVVVGIVLIAMFAAVIALIAFAIGRAVPAAWAAWDRLRRTHLRWALTHSLLVASLILAAVIGALLAASVFATSVSRIDLGAILPPDAPWHEQALATIVFHYIPAVLAVFLGPLLLGVVIVPPVALIAFPVLRRATRRIEALARATSAVRGGDLAARTEVSGEDEIARLQADFNAMAADLERTVDELRAERDAVGRLLAARRELVAAVSHELRTPLATLRGYLDSALDHGDDRLAPSLRQDLDIMSAEVDRLHRLTDDLFTLSRAEVGRLPLTMAPTAVGPLLAGVAGTAAPLAWSRGRVEVVAQAPNDLPPVLADPERLEQVVRNLVTNAIRHTPPGGLVLISAAPAGDQVEIQVRDTGEGIAPADLPLVWDRFYRAGDSRDRAGAGLGLALVKELTEAMGGSVHVESALGEGSCFTLRLSRVPAPTQPPIDSPQPALTGSPSIPDRASR